MDVMELGRVQAASLGRPKSPVVHATPPQVSGDPVSSRDGISTRRMADGTRAEGTGQDVVGWRWSGVVTGGLVAVTARGSAQGEGLEFLLSLL